MGRTPCCEKVGLRKGPWSADEDLKLLSYIQKHGHGSWRHLPPKAGLQRCGKSCRLRWTNYLRPDIKRGNFSLQEEQTIIQLHALLGNRWSTIANHLPRRTDNEIKNYWNTHLKKRLTKMGIDPMTHKPKANVLIIGSSDDQSKDISNLNHMAQWEIARLEAEARLVREAKFVIPNPINSLSKDSLLALPPLNKQQPMVSPCLDILKASERSSWADINLNFNVGTLLSPNSVLMPPFPDNMNFITASASVSPRLDNYAQKGNEVEGTIEMQEIMGSFSDQVDFGDQSFSLGIPNGRLMEFPDEFLLSDNCCGGGYLEDNKYWN